MFTILSISDSDKHFRDAIKEYQKRLGKFVDIQNIKPTRYGSVTQIIDQDTQNIINLLKKKYAQHTKIILNSEGKDVDTHALHDFCFARSQIVFVIGGAYGLNYKNLLPYIDLQLSLGKITLPHGLAKLVLIEQIYRIDTIQRGKKYHY